MAAAVTASVNAVATVVKQPEDRLTLDVLYGPRWLSALLSKSLRKQFHHPARAQITKNEPGGGIVLLTEWPRQVHHQGRPYRQPCCIDDYPKSTTESHPGKGTHLRLVHDLS